MFIGEEFDTDDDAHTTTHANHSSLTKLRRAEEREEIESVLLKPTEDEDDVIIPLITTENVREEPHPRASSTTL